MCGSHKVYTAKQTRKRVLIIAPTETQHHLVAHLNHLAAARHQFRASPSCIPKALKLRSVVHPLPRLDETCSHAAFCLIGSGLWIYLLTELRASNKQNCKTCLRPGFVPSQCSYYDYLFISIIKLDLLLVSLAIPLRSYWCHKMKVW